MSKIYKAAAVQIDENNKVFINTGGIGNYSNNEVEYIPKIEENHNYQADKSDFDQKAYEAEIISNAESLREEIIQNAQKEAEEIIQNAKIEAENIYSERYNLAYDNGYNEGKEQGQNDAIDETKAMKEEAQEIIESAKIEKENIVNDLEPQIVNLIYTIVEDLVKVEMKYDTSLLLSLVKEGINNTTILEKITLKLSEEDYDFITEQKEDLEKLIDSSKELNIIKDFSLQNGDCIIETDFGYVNCSIDEKLKELKKNMELILKSR